MPLNQFLKEGERRLLTLGKDHISSQSSRTATPPATRSKYPVSISNRTGTPGSGSGSDRGGSGAGAGEPSSTARRSGNERSAEVIFYSTTNRKS
jgi:hypothetical protein